MSKEKKRILIGKKEAAMLLGLKTTNRVAVMIKEGILNSYQKEGSQRRWLDYNEVFNLPKKLPRPLPDEYFQNSK